MEEQEHAKNSLQEYMKIKTLEKFATNKYQIAISYKALLRLLKKEII